MFDTEIDGWASQYRAELAAYESCTSKLESLIRDLLEGAEIDVVDVQSRAKGPDSLERKVDAKRESYKAPLTDVTDLIGVRVIAYYLEDVERIQEVIASEFVIDDENSSDKLDGMEPDRFGYRSVHFVVSLAEQRASLAEWAIFDGKKAEIQVRTATQHAWAAVEHKLNYKRTSEAPRELRRRLMRLSALFELADEQFSAVRDELEAVEARYSSDVRVGNLDLPVDTASLEVFLDENPLVEALVDEFASRGLGMASPDLEGYEERYDRDLRDLASLLEILGFHTIAELEETIREISDDTETIELIASSFRRVFEEVWRSPADLLTLFVGLARDVPSEVFEPVYHPDVVRVIRRLRDEDAS